MDQTRSQKRSSTPQGIGYSLSLYLSEAEQRTPAGIRLHFFSLAGDGKRNRRIDQCLHWSMNTALRCSILIRIPAGRQKKARRMACFLLLRANQTRTKPVPHGVSARGDWLFPLAILSEADNSAAQPRHQAKEPPPKGVALCLVLQRGFEPRETGAGRRLRFSASLKKRFAFWCPGFESVEP